jgi:hypothetical protein
MTKKWYNYFVVTTPVEVPPAEASSSNAAASVPGVPVRVADIAPDADPEKMPPAPVGTPADFGEIYESAQLSSPAHGYTVLKVAEMLQSEHIHSLPRDVKQRSILVALDAAGVKVTDIIEDAVRRDRALDAYERVLVKHLEDVERQTAQENQRIEDEVNRRVAELRTQLEASKSQLAKEQADLATWRADKRREEARIAEAVGYFVSENPITTSTASVKDKGGSDVR